MTPLCGLSHVPATISCEQHTKSRPPFRKWPELWKIRAGRSIGRWHSLPVISPHRATRYSLRWILDSRTIVPPRWQSRGSFRHLHPRSSMERKTLRMRGREKKIARRIWKVRWFETAVRISELMEKTSTKIVLEYTKNWVEKIYFVEHLDFIKCNFCRMIFFYKLLWITSIIIALVFFKRNVQLLISIFKRDTYIIYIKILIYFNENNCTRSSAILQHLPLERFFDVTLQKPESHKHTGNWNSLFPTLRNFTFANITIQIYNNSPKKCYSRKFNSFGSFNHWSIINQRKVKFR